MLLESEHERLSKLSRSEMTMEDAKDIISNYEMFHKTIRGIAVQKSLSK